MMACRAGIAEIVHTVARHRGHSEAVASEVTREVLAEHRPDMSEGEVIDRIKAAFKPWDVPIEQPATRHSRMM